MTIGYLNLKRLGGALGGSPAVSTRETFACRWLVMPVGLRGYRGGGGGGRWANFVVASNFRNMPDKQLTPELVQD